MIFKHFHIFYGNVHRFISVFLLSISSLTEKIFVYFKMLKVDLGVQENLTNRAREGNCSFDQSIFHYKVGSRIFERV